MRTAIFLGLYYIGVSIAYTHEMQPSNWFLCIVDALTICFIVMDVAEFIKKMGWKIERKPVYKPSSPIPPIESRHQKEGAD